jgi:hypothetical protein
MTSISLDTFYSCQRNINDSGIFKEKAKNLINTYKCFTDTSNNFRERVNNKGKAFVPVVTERPEKIKIGSRELSREYLAKKEYMSLMNKLSDQNKKQINNMFKAIIREDCYKLYIEMTWDMMLRFPEFQKLYFDLIKILYDYFENKTDFINIWMTIINDYESLKKWIPSDDILDDKDYDEFCDFQKWKKRAVASLSAIKLLSIKEWIPIHIIKNISDKLLNTCKEYLKISNGIGCKVLDSLLDQLIIVYDNIEDKLIVDFINESLMDVNIRSSSKFKLLDIKEKVEIKLSTTYKVKYK